MPDERGSEIMMTAVLVRLGDGLIIVAVIGILIIAIVGVLVQIAKHIEKEATPRIRSTRDFAGFSIIKLLARARVWKHFEPVSGGVRLRHFLTSGCAQRDSAAGP
jgi:hypothetical protein